MWFEKDHKCTEKKSSLFDRESSWVDVRTVELWTTTLVHSKTGTTLTRHYVSFWSLRPVSYWHRLPNPSITLDKMLQNKVKIHCTWIFEHSFIFWSCGMVLVTTKASKVAALIRGIAGPENMPCVKMAYTLEAPASDNFWAAWQTVPHVSAISSTRMAVRSRTSPTSTIEATSLAFLRSLWMRAKSTFKRSAIEVTLLAPPASGDTITVR